MLTIEKQANSPGLPPESRNPGRPEARTLSKLEAEYKNKGVRGNSMEPVSQLASPYMMDRRKTAVIPEITPSQISFIPHTRHTADLSPSLLE